MQKVVLLLQTEIKLLNVARASFQELLLDYEDYLRVRELNIWDLNSEKAIQARKVCKEHNDSVFYRKAIKERDDETIAKAVNKVFDLRPAAIIDTLDLRRPIYSQTAAYGHMGRTDIDLPWEKTDKVDELKSAL